jgi:hypothetical protein
MLKLEKLYTNKDDPGTEMYIIYNGQVGLHNNKELISKVPYNNVFNEKVIEQKAHNEYTAIAITD